MPMKLGPSSVPCVTHDLFVWRTCLSILVDEKLKGMTIPSMKPLPLVMH